MLRSIRFGATLIFALVIVAQYSFALKLEDIRDFNKKDQAALKKRYEEYQNNPQIFTPEQFQYIEDKGLTELIGLLILHPEIKLTDAQLLLDFAQTILESGFQFRVLEPRITKYIKKDMIPFDALELAIEREKSHQWKLAQIKKIKGESNSFVRSIQRTELDSDEAEKVISVYATCVAPYSDVTLRETIKPSICKDNEEFKKPRHKEDKNLVRTKPSSHKDARSIAYGLFITEIQDVADRYNLNSFERMRMAKCVAEQALQFFPPKEHPLRAVCKMVDMHTKSPEDAFFMHSGVCANFSGIAYNVAREIGFEDRVYLAEKGVHVYIEFEENGTWYHLHPFNSQGKCDITRF